MLTCYVTPDELYQFADIRRWNLPSSVVTSALGAATYDLAESLRGRGVNPARVQIPLMFSGTHYSSVTYTGNSYTPTVDATNQSRLVVDIGSISGQATITLYGTNDEVTWSVVDGINGDAQIVTQSTGLYSVLFVPRYAKYRCYVETEDSVTASLFLVDSGPDRAIKSMAVAIALLPYIGKDSTIVAVYDESKDNYQQALNRMVLDYDADGDGVVTAVEQNTNLSFIIARR